MTKSRYRLGSERRGAKGFERCPGLPEGLNDPARPCGGHKAPWMDLCQPCREELMYRNAMDAHRSREEFVRKLKEGP